MPYKPGCGHRWTVLPLGPQGRLKCEWCGAVGYTRRGLPGARRKQNRIFVYICDVKGCHRDAVVVRDGGHKRCKKHKEE